MQLQTWQTVFLALLAGVSLALLIYTDGRRLLHAAVDDRYGQWVRAWRQADLGFRLNYALAFFFCHGLRDLTRLSSLLAFDLFVVFALLSPFWRYLFFEDWNPGLATALGLAGTTAYLGWRLRSGAELCWVHGWSDEWVCERCGEYHSRAEEIEARRKKSAKPGAMPLVEPAGLRHRLSWHGFWTRRLEDLDRRLESAVKS